MSEKTIAELIAEPGCDMQCPVSHRKGHKEDGEPACCAGCASTGGFWEDGEMDQRVADGLITQAEADGIRKTVSTVPNGALDPGKGCRLERRLWSRTCLEWKCNKNTVVQQKIYEGVE